MKMELKMSTFNEVKKARIQALKDKDVLSKSVLDMIVANMDNKGVSRLEGEAQEKATIESLKAVKIDLNKLANSFDKEFTQKGKELPEIAKEALAKNALEHAVVDRFLPSKMSNEALEKLIDGLIEEKGKDFGAVMKVLKTEHSGQFDGKHASTYAKEKTQ